MSGVGTKTIWTASLAILALLSGTAGLIGNLGGARNTICSLPAAKQTCIRSGLITYIELEKINAAPTSAVQTAPALGAGGQAPPAPAAGVQTGAVPTVQPAPNPNDISGTWSGYYFGGSNPRTKFELNIAWRSTGAFRGVIAEDDSVGRAHGIDTHGVERGSTVTGKTHEDGSVTFTKEYDCSNGICHKVIYDGVLDEAGRTITGTWRIDDTHGEFKATRN